MSTSASGSAGKSITIKSRDEIRIMEEANRIVAEVLVMLQNTVEPGITTFELDRMAEERSLSWGGWQRRRGGGAGRRAANKPMKPTALSGVCIGGSFTFAVVDVK